MFYNFVIVQILSMKLFLICKFLQSIWNIYLFNDKYFKKDMRKIMIILLAKYW